MSVTIRLSLGFALAVICRLVTTGFRGNVALPVRTKAQRWTFYHGNHRHDSYSPRSLHRNQDYEHENLKH